MRRLARLVWLTACLLAFSTATWASEPQWAARVSDLPIIHIEVPAAGEVWIRVDPNHAGEARDVMSEVATRYRKHESTAGDVTVVLWVGGRPLARETYAAPAPEDDDEASPSARTGGNR